MSDEILSPKLARAVELLKQPPADVEAGRARLLEAIASERARQAADAATAPVRSIEAHRARKQARPWRWITGLAVAAGLGALAVSTLRSPVAGPGDVATGSVPAVVPVVRGEPGLSGGPVPGGAQQVQFVLMAPDAQSVTVAGDFNGWNATALPMAEGTNGLWSVAVPLEPGRYRYAFVVNGTEWRADPNAAGEPSDEFGATSVIVVGGGE